MTQYINKAAVVAEIKRISCENPMDNSWYVDTEELLNFINTLEVKLEVQEEPVSEDLGEYINDLSKQFPEVSFAKLSRIAVRVANWQKEQFEKNRLAACDKQTEEEAEIERDFVTGIIDKEHRLPTFDDAIKYGIRLKEKEMQSTIELAEDHAMLAGMNKMEQQMMENAVETTFNVSLPSGLYDKLWIKGCKEGDKLLVIKKDEL